MRQLCTWPRGFWRLACLLLLGCVSEARQEEWRIRLDIDDLAVKATVLGSAAVDGEEVPLDPLGRPRSPAALAIRAERDRELHIVDPTASILDQLEHLDPIPPLPGEAPETRELHTILLTHRNSQTLEGLKLLLERLEPGRMVPIYASKQVLRAIADDSTLRLLGLLDRVELREAVDGESLRLGASVLLTPIISPVDSARYFLGFRIEGSRRGLLYLPACGDLDTVKQALVQQTFGPVQVALLDGTRFDHREEAQPGWPKGCHPPMTSVLGLLPEGFASQLLLRFTRLTTGNPTLDPDGRHLGLLVDRGAGLLEDGAEYWL